MNRFVLLIVSSCLAGCNGLFYFPDRVLVRIPTEVGIPFEPVEVRSEGTSTLRGWFLPTKMPSKGTVLFLHGNAENISTHLAEVYWLPSEGYQVFLFDYAGYGASEGEPELESIHHDVERMIERVRMDPRVDKSRLFLLGQSLGAVMAIHVAAEVRYQTTFAGVIAEAPFASYREIAREKLASLWLTYFLQWPLGFLIDDDFSANRAIGAVRSPVVFVHGDRDEVVPSSHSAELCAIQGPSCERWIIEGAGHSECFVRLDVRKRLVDWLTKNGTGSGTTPPDNRSRSSPGTQ